MTSCLTSQNEIVFIKTLLNTYLTFSIIRLRITKYTLTIFYFFKIREMLVNKKTFIMLNISSFIFLTIYKNKTNKFKKKQKTANKKVCLLMWFKESILALTANRLQ